MRVVVCTIVHHPADARIYHTARSGPCSTRGTRSPTSPRRRKRTFSAERIAPELRVIPVPRGRGTPAGSAPLARRPARAGPARARSADLLLIHDPELLLALPPRRIRPPTVWDVHEDTAAALSTKPWLPATAAASRRRRGACRAERLAEQRLHLILAEQGYVERFSRPHPVVPNTTYVPETGPPPDPPGAAQRVIYVGWLSPDRGVAEMIELGALLRPHGITVELIGQADARARALIEPAQAQGLLRWPACRPQRPGHAHGRSGALGQASRCSRTSPTSGTHCPPRWWSTWPAACPW